MRFRRLSRDYFAPQKGWPWTRLILAAALTPIGSALIITLLMAGVAAYAPHAADWPFQAPAPFFFELALELAFFALVGIVPVFLLLWSLRLKSQTAFVVGGLCAGLIGAGTSYLRFGDISGSQIGIAVGLGVFLALFFRALAGIRRLA